MTTATESPPATPAVAVPETLLALARRAGREIRSLAEAAERVRRADREHALAGLVACARAGLPADLLPFVAFPEPEAMPAAGGVVELVASLPEYLPVAAAYERLGDPLHWERVPYAGATPDDPHGSVAWWCVYLYRGRRESEPYRHAHDLGAALHYAAPKADDPAPF